MIPGHAMLWRFAPFFLFAVLGGFFLLALLDEQGEPSSGVVVLRQAPAFNLPPLDGFASAGFSGSDLRNGRISLVNVWASWCAPCRAEHPLLNDLAQRRDIQLLGLNYKDDPVNARRFLNRMGNPFARVGSDRDGRIALDWGVYGIPETFVVDGEGRIIVQHKGPLTPDVVTRIITPALDGAARKAENDS